MSFNASVRSPCAQVTKLFDAAFETFLRLFKWASDQKLEVELLSWSDSPRNQILFQNSCMEACLMSLKAVSSRRSAMSQGNVPGLERAVEADGSQVEAAFL